MIVERAKTGPTEPPRGPTLGELRQQAAVLRDHGLSYARIGAAMNVPAIRARDLCRQFDRYARLGPAEICWMELSGRAVMALAAGKYAARVGSEMVDRIARLVEIAAAYSRQDLMDEQEVGVATVTEIEVWLQSKGLGLRRRTTPVARAMRKARLTMAARQADAQRSLPTDISPPSIPVSESPAPFAVAPEITNPAIRSHHAGPAA